MTGFVCKIINSGDLKSGDFFSDQLPPPPDRVRQYDPYPPPPTEQFRGKNVDLSIRDFVGN